MDATMIFNLNDANCELPTTGKAWEILLEHVKENAMHRDLYLGDLADEDIIEEVKRRELSVADVFDDQDIADHVHDGGMPMEEIFDEDEILACGCVIDAMDELEKKRAKTRKKNAELEEKVAELKNTNDKLREANRTLGAKNAELMKVVGDVERIAELERQLAVFREWHEKMRWNENPEWCRSCGTWDKSNDGDYESDNEEHIVHDGKWGYVCLDCLHHLDNEDHERCGKCDGCKDCGCECEEDELCEAIDASGNALY